MQDKNLPAVIFQSNPSLNIPPPPPSPGIPWAFDIFSCKGGREFDELIFVPGTWHLITTHRGWGIWTLASISYYMTVQVTNSNRKIPDSWWTGWKALKVCTSFALCLKVLKNHLYFGLGRGEFEQNFFKNSNARVWGGGGGCLSFNLTGTLYDWLIKGDSFLTPWLPRGLPLTSKIVKGLRLTKESSRVQPCFRRRSAGSITCTAAGPSNRA